ncbi:CU044_2847 family protein, partial [Streptomyces sp. NPDC059003]|uniref:CU044_2847 family protein n=1 Tax=Streptomyces sp. NPDC059003 TaxID=3346691 RepID=UPI0036CE7256
MDDGLVQFTTDDGARVVVADVDDASGARLVSRGDGPAQAARTFEASLDGARAAADSALRVFRDGTLRPDAVEIEFGVRMTAEAGAVLVKGSAEGHLLVRLSWSPERPTGGGAGAGGGASAGESAGVTGPVPPTDGAHHAGTGADTAAAATATAGATGRGTAGGIAPPAGTDAGAGTAAPAAAAEPTATNHAAPPACPGANADVTTPAGASEPDPPGGVATSVHAHAGAGTA